MPAVMQGATLSISIFANTFLTVAGTLSGPYILEDSVLDQITFMVIAVCCLFSATFSYFFIKTTDGLTDVQKRYLYVKSE